MDAYHVGVVQHEDKVPLQPGNHAWAKLLVKLVDEVGLLHSSTTTSVEHKGNQSERTRIQRSKQIKVRTSPKLYSSALMCTNHLELANVYCLPSSEIILNYYSLSSLGVD